MSDEASDPESLDVLDRIAKASGSSEIYRVTAFKGWRKHKDGSTKEISVEILDRGPRDYGRWMVIARDKDGREATGNPDQILTAAIAGVHWNDLDGDIVR